MISVYIEDETGSFPDELRDIITSVAKEAAREENFTVNSEVNVLIVNNDSIREINKEYRNVDSATDVLSFPMEDFDEDGILGDLVISSERAAEQSADYGHSIRREIGFLTAHGMMHLFGYDHITPEGEEEMFAKQEKILNNLGLTRE